MWQYFKFSGFVIYCTSLFGFWILKNWCDRANIPMDINNEMFVRISDIGLLVASQAILSIF